LSQLLKDLIPTPSPPIFGLLCLFSMSIMSWGVS
jgi:hypothetical protein